uniref:SH3 domain-containing protein n=1 Tax=Strongyloides papillosus TaxID=174720 RepID=A0A0N5BUF1_STREA
MVNINIGHNYIISKLYNSTDNSIIFEKYDIVEVKDLRQDYCFVTKIKDDVSEWIPIDVLNSNHIDKLPTPTRNHYSLACHLNPRLSESNLNFHDIFWRTTCNIMRKREVKLSKFIKILSITNKQKVKKNCQYIVKCFLYDCGSKAGRQIVSNIHTISINSATGNNNFLFTKSDIATFLIRSNYNQQEVVLRINIFEVVRNQNNEDIHENIGSIMVNLLNNENKVILQNKAITYFVRKNQTDDIQSNDVSIKISINDVPIGQKGDVDILPDVIICKAEYICLFSIFRNLCAHKLFSLREKSDMGRIGYKKMNNFLYKYFFTDYINDDFIEKFLEIVDNEDIVNHLHLLCIKYGIYKSKNKISSFNEIFKRHIIPLTIVYGINNQIDQNLGSQTSLKNIQQSKLDLARNLDIKDDFDEITFLANQKCKPVNLRNCTFQLCNLHSLD